MAAAPSRKTRSIAFQTAQLALAVPQVMAHRLTRLALAGPTPSARDRKEFALMSAEKTDAFAASFNNMALQTLRAQQQLAFSCMRSMWSPTFWTSASAARELQGAALGILDKGMTPVRRKAVANAKRLARTKLR